MACYIGMFSVAKACLLLRPHRRLVERDLDLERVALSPTQLDMELAVQVVYKELAITEKRQFAASCFHIYRSNSGSGPGTSHR